MNVLVFVALLVAVILFALAGWSRRVHDRDLLPWGLFAFALAFLLPAFQAL